MGVLFFLLFVILFISGVILVIKHRKNTRNVVKIIFWCIVIGLPIYLLMNHRLNRMHKLEIHRVIEFYGGHVEEIKKVNSKDSPFGESGSANTIYKIQYLSNGEVLTAWYRAIDNIGDIHEPVSKGYDEQWIMDQK
ncbi:uncharacterized protein with PQ loop repeat [Paenibacillus phyllosphaerae]|uniref:Uncharacterized protein with PQ loop repeat n=2 Tax=Paenibacillus phyllosphaerae TaxID=274593 RepID=A0A7W5FMX6_9BACL|nr:uncharacterized protein with PQ loop repeat [Paenibacillus phyllosphaerae]